MSQAHENLGELALAQVRHTIVNQLKSRIMNLSQNLTNGKTSAPQPRRRDLLKATRDYKTLTASFSPVQLDMFKQLAESRPDMRLIVPAPATKPRLNGVGRRNTGRDQFGINIAHVDHLVIMQPGQAVPAALHGIERRFEQVVKANGAANHAD